MYAGSLGVVTEMTLKCIPQMNLLEKSAVTDRNKMDVSEHVERLRLYRHVRYMWVPYTNTVVTVVSNPTDRTVASNNSIVAILKTGNDLAFMPGSAGSSARSLDLCHSLLTSFHGILI